MQFFNDIEMAPPDPILGLTVAFKEDKRTNKINLGVGSYKTADLKPFVLISVKKAEEALLHEEHNKDYLPIEGDHEYLNLTQKLVFGEISHHHEPIIGVQTLGGTGALRVAAAFLIDHMQKNIYMPDPTWDNHKRIFQHAGFQSVMYPYYSQKHHAFDFDGLVDAIRQMPEKSVVVLHGCCHNPTGIDPNLDQWETIFKELMAKNLFPLFDLAYQGFGEGLEADVKPIRALLTYDYPFCVAVSHSKNFGLYGERVGALFFACHGARKVLSQIKVRIRGLYSNPPSHGARIVRRILSNDQLRTIWEHEVETMRKRIVEMRKALIAQFQICGVDFDFLAKQKGMFSYTGLKSDQVEQLMSDYGIYLPSDGRINVAGLNTEIVPDVAEAIANVVKKNAEKRHS